MKLFLAPYRAPLRQAARSQDLRASEAFSRSPVNTGAAQSGAPLTLKKFVFSVCQETVNRVRKTGLTIRISLTPSDADITLAPFHARMALAEMIANAIEFSFYERSSGALCVTFSETAENALRISVSDDGWGPDILAGNSRTGRFSNLHALGRVTVSPASSSGTGMIVSLISSNTHFLEKSSSVMGVEKDVLLNRPYLLDLVPKIMTKPSHPRPTSGEECNLNRPPFQVGDLSYCP